VACRSRLQKHLKLLWSKAMVVSVEEKVPLDGISAKKIDMLYITFYNAL
jgi:hypothetical protein